MSNVTLEQHLLFIVMLEQIIFDVRPVSICLFEYSELWINKSNLLISFQFQILDTYSEPREYMTRDKGNFLSFLKLNSSSAENLKEGLRIVTVFEPNVLKRTKRTPFLLFLRVKKQFFEVIIHHFRKIWRVPRWPLVFTICTFFHLPKMS